MKAEVKLTEAVGKTLQAVEFSESYCGGQAVLAFTDDTFATLGVERGYESGDEEIKEDALAVFDFGDKKLARAGIVTLDEMAAMRAADAAATGRSAGVAGSARSPRVRAPEAEVWGLTPKSPAS